MILSGLYNLLLADPGVSAIIAAKGVYFTLAAEQAARPFVVIHIVSAPPAETSLDGVSELISGRFQFDCYADDQLSARKLSRAVRDLLKNYSGGLSDGTAIQFTAVNLDMDDPYEVGGQGFVFRSLLDLSAFYTEGA